MLSQSSISVESSRKITTTEGKLSISPLQNLPKNLSRSFIFNLNFHRTEININPLELRMDQAVNNQKMLAAIRQRALKKKKAKQGKSQQQEDDSLVTNILTPKDQKRKNKNKDKVLQTETYKGSKTKEPKVLEIIPRSKSATPQYPKKDKKSKKNNKFVSSEEDEEDNSIQEPVKSKPKEKSVLEKRSLEKMLSGEDLSFMKFEEAEETQQNQPSYLVAAEEGMKTIDNMFKKLKKSKNEDENTDRKSAREVYLSSNEKGSRRNKDAVDEEEEKKMAPWMSSATKNIENTTLRFHNEIMDFVEYVGPSKKEDAIRKKSFEK